MWCPPICGHPQNFPTHNLAYGKNARHYVQICNKALSSKPPTGALPKTTLGDFPPPCSSSCIKWHSVHLLQSTVPQYLAEPGTRVTDEWLDDTENQFGPNLPLLFKMTASVTRSWTRRSGARDTVWSGNKEVVQSLTLYKWCICCMNLSDVGWVLTSNLNVCRLMWFAWSDEQIEI